MLISVKRGCVSTVRDIVLEYCTKVPAGAQVITTLAKLSNVNG